jgi:hypothetical protein
MVLGVGETDRSLVLRLYGSGEDFCGEARTGEGEPRAFSSWIEMVGLIEGWQAEEIRRNRSAPAAHPTRQHKEAS